ncbi:MAG: hypothetical protein KME51_04650 [Candidatus Thiodiazotropha sp. (ex Ctena orbiculata)]|nr:hypothetical protein [Candidatus Thiodiazotropha taylori]
MWDLKVIQRVEALLAVSLLAVANFAQSAMPVGIPDPASSVPAAIMPTLPSSESQIPAFPYDPINMPTPQWADRANQYYVDSSSADCDDASNDGRGNPTTPRCSLPGLRGTTSSLNPGDQLFIAGNGARYGNAQHVERADMPGTATDPIWIIGAGERLPELNFERFSWQRGRHVIFDSVHFRSPEDNFRMRWSDATGPIEYFTFRSVDCSGSEGTHSNASRRCFSLGGSSSNILQFVVFHDIDIWGLGRWQDDRRTSRDLLGIQLQKWSRYVWVLDSRIRNIQGDSIMCGNSNWWDFDRASRPHYLYVGGSEFYENYENGYDQKGCYHVVFSENHVHDIYNSQKPANATAIITEQDSEGDVGGKFTWFLNNLVENAGTAFRSSATTDDAFIYILGNVVRNIDSAALSFTQRCYSGGSNGQTCPEGLVFAQNTVDCNLKATGVSNTQNPVGSNQVVEIDGNIFYNCIDGGEGSTQNWESFSEQPLYLKHVNNVDYRVSGGDVTLNTRRFDVLENNLLNTPPLISTGDSIYNLLDGSPAANLVEQQNSAYNSFSAMYGLDIRKDRMGNSWTSTSTINAGANQGDIVVTPSLAPPSAPILLVN